MSYLRFAVFLGVFTTLLGLIHLYLWLRLIREPAHSGGLTRALTVGLIVLGALIPVAMVLSRGLPRVLASPLAWVAFVWLAMMFLLLVATAGLDLVRGAGLLMARLTGGSVSEERRAFFARALFWVAVPSALISTFVGGVSAAPPIRVKPVRVPLRRLPTALKGFSIVQMTDIHVGPTVGLAFVKSLVESCNRLKPDVVVITGDLVDGSVEELGHLVEPFGQLKARHGVFFVTGNHEYYSGADPWIGFLIGLGIRVLQNDRVEIQHDGAILHLAGVDDYAAHEFGLSQGPDVARAVAGRDAAHPLVLLAHQPKVIHDAARHGVSLQLSGHTHGGQIWPFGLLVPLVQPYVAGLHRHKEGWIYVSQGTGYWGPPVRLGAPSEITRIELHPEA